MDNREKIVAAVMGDFLPSFSFDNSTSVLLVENYTGTLQESFKEKVVSVDTWNRRFVSEGPAPSLWPEGKDYTHVFIRLPKSHQSFDMILHAIGFLCTKNTEIVVYGSNDEGIKSAQKKMQEFFGSCDVVGFKKGCRVLRSVTSEKFLTKKNSLKDFKEEIAVSYASIDYKLTSYPGVFNGSALDDGTKLLLDTSLPLIKGNEKVLDFACGTGIIAKVIKKKFPDINIEFLDNDIIALEAAKENLEECKNTKPILGDSLAPCKEKYDLIISNPPMHIEKDEHTNVIKELIATASEKLNASGKLIIVTQSRLTLEKNFTDAFASHSILARNTKFTVWCGVK